MALSLRVGVQDKSYASVFLILAGKFLFVPSDAFAVGCSASKRTGKKQDSKKTRATVLTYEVKLYFMEGYQLTKQTPPFVLPTLHQKYGIPYLLTFCSLKHSLHLDVINFWRPTIRSVSLSCPLAPIPNAPWLSSETSALYKSLTYLLTHLQNTRAKCFRQPHHNYKTIKI